MNRAIKGSTAGASGANSPLEEEALDDAQKALALLARHCGALAAELLQATRDLEADPASESRRLLLQEKVHAARAHTDEDLQNTARALFNAKVTVGTNHGEVNGVKVGTVNASVSQSAVGNNIALAIDGGIAKVDSSK